MTTRFGRRLTTVGVAMLAAFALVAGCGTDDDGTPGASPSASVTPSSSSPSASPSDGVTAPIYYLGEVTYQQGEEGETAMGFRLFREWHPVTPADDSPLAVAEAAVTELLTGAPADPDYASAWPADAEVLSVTHADGVITVDLSGIEQANVGAESAELTIQQLIYTVQGTLADQVEPHAVDPVRITLDGAEIPELWGHIDTSAPIARAPTTGTLAPIWVTEPAEGATVSAPVQVTGIAQVFEATVNWEVLRNGEVVDYGFAMAAEGAPAFAPYEFTVELAPGEYTLKAFEASALDGTPIYVETKSFTVE